MFRAVSKIVAFLALAAGPSFAIAAENLQAREWDVETDTVITSLPTSVPMPMTARSCMTCKGVDLQVTKETEFFADKTPISLVELRRAAKTRHFMMVFYKPATHVVTRVVVHGVSPVTK